MLVRKGMYVHVRPCPFCRCTLYAMYLHVRLHAIMQKCLHVCACACACDQACKWYAPLLACTNVLAIMRVLVPVLETRRHATLIWGLYCFARQERLRGGSQAA